MESRELIFVYNADSGILNAVMDSLHKVFSPSTYDCNLCALTYTSVSMKKDWKHFVSNLELPVRFLHRDELIRDHGMKDVALPSVLVLNEKAPEVLIDAGEINGLDSLEQLMSVVCLRVNRLFTQ